jgi:hypothetical protein
MFVSRPPSSAAAPSGGEVAQAIATVDIPVVVKDIGQKFVVQRSGKRGRSPTANSPGWSKRRS